MTDVGRAASKPSDSKYVATPARNAEVIRDVQYAKIDGLPLKLDLYLPKNRTDTPPLLVWIHGGNWKSGRKDRCPLAWLTRHDFAVTSLQYRLSGQAIFPAQIHDCKGAVRWLRANAEMYRYSAEKVDVSGISAGGHLATLIGTSSGMKELEGTVGGNLDQSSRAQARLNMCGASDFVRIRTLHYRKDLDNPNAILAQLLGGPFMKKRDLARLDSPVPDISEDDPPLLIFHGEKDPLVPLDQSIHLSDRYRNAGLAVSLETIPNEPHVPQEFWDARRRSLTLDFFNQHLR
ncbi:MAG: alpha/beta hydrolase fold domain-containing protein [Limisphaerales bacterium]